MGTEGSRWVEATLAGTATSPAWEATMITVRFNFVPLFNVNFLILYTFLVLTHIFLYLNRQPGWNEQQLLWRQPWLSRHEWHGRRLGHVDAPKEVYLSFGSSRFCWGSVLFCFFLFFVMMTTMGRIRFTPCPPFFFLNLNVGISIIFPAIPELKVQPLISSVGDCPRAPLVMLVNILQKYGSLQRL